MYTGSLSKKFKRADKVKASYAIILGEEELENKVIKLKNLSSSIEKYMKLGHAIETIKKNLNK